MVLSDLHDWPLETTNLGLTQCGCGRVRIDALADDCFGSFIDLLNLVFPEDFSFKDVALLDPSSGELLDLSHQSLFLLDMGLYYALKSLIFE